MTAATRVAKWYGYGDLRLEEERVPSPGSDESLVEMVACGVCGTDVHALTDPSFSLWEAPRVIGHEAVGIVRESAALPTGSLVALEPSLSCESCFHCREGEELLCPTRRLLGGFLADFVVVPNRAVHVVEDGLPWRRAVLAEPLSCVLHAVSRSELRPGEWCGVMGAGTVGLLCLMVARRHGARVVVTEIDPARRKAAEQLGADLVVDPSTEDVESEIGRVTGGVGLDRVIEAVGIAETVEGAMRMVRRGGTVVVMGVAAADVLVGVSPYDLYAREITLRGSFIRQFDFQRSLRFARLEPLERLLSSELPLERLREVIERTARGEGIKSIVTFPAVEEMPA